MKLKPLKYLIQIESYESIMDVINGTLQTEPVAVDGYAIECDLPVRICVHRVQSGAWRADHYDTGYYFGKEHKLKAMAVKNGIVVMRGAIASGEYARVMRELGYAP